ncbi:N-acetylmuramoyl-L-alanine amidase [Neomoorella thermoacetica]|uniref:N-acetylmuramoyl-L-alanine amidase n=1 Tax=Neomoorella thermoacetica TaxID=1525 RepID=UPI0030D16421
MRELPPRARLTNLHSKINSQGEEQFSTVTIEATAPAPVEVSYPEPTLCQVTVRAAMNMYPGPLYVQDGIIREVTLHTVAEETVFNICLDEAVQAVITCIEGTPYRICLNFNRRPMQNFYQDRVVVIDPGHGGSDPGHRGPVNLLERDMAWKTAWELARILEGLKARVVMTRRQEENPSWQERLARVPPGAFCFLSIHEYGSPDAARRGTAVLYNPARPENEELAAAVLERIVTRVKTPPRGTSPDAELVQLGQLPALRIEPVTITNWVDEGLLRNPYFHQKTALAVVVAIKQYFRQRSKDYGPRNKENSFS